MIADGSQAASNARPDAGEPRSVRRREVEIKLAGDPSIIARVYSLDPLVGISPQEAESVQTTYFDTQDDALDRLGIALRIRKIGERRLLSMKWPPEGEGLFSRGEAEADIDSEVPNVESLGTELARMVERATEGGQLVPRFTTRVRRQRGNLISECALLEIAVDQGEIVAGDRSAPIAECEIELKRGEPAALFELARQLACERLFLSPEPKAGRGYRLARGGAPAEVTVIHPCLNSTATVEDAICALVEATLSQFTGNWPAFREAELPESIHQMRVGLRRLRAGLAPFEKAFPNAGFEVFRAKARRIASALGPARDQDIFGALVMEGPLSVFPRDQSFEALLSVSLKRRAQAYSAVRQLLTEPDTTCFVIDLESFVARRAWRNVLDTEKLRKLTEPALLFATKILERLDRRARKRAKDLLRLGPEERHLVRIALKNLRYAADFFASLFDDGKRSRQFMKCLGDLQNELGARNDEAVVAKMAGELEKEADVVAVRAAGIVLGWCTRGSEDTSAQLRDAWHAYLNVPRFWHSDMR